MNGGIRVSLVYVTKGLKRRDDREFRVFQCFREYTKVIEVNIGTHPVRAVRLGLRRADDGWHVRAVTAVGHSSGFDLTQLLYYLPVDRSIVGGIFRQLPQVCRCFLPRMLVVF